jgi:hypothetical protein
MCGFVTTITNAGSDDGLKLKALSLKMLNEPSKPSGVRIYCSAVNIL